MTKPVNKIEKLIAELCPEGVEWKTLGEVCEMKAGKSISTSDISSSRSEENIYPCIGGNGSRGYVNSFSHSGKFPIIGRQGALCGNVCFAEGKFYATEHAVVVKPGEQFIARFLYHLLVLMNLNQYASGGAQPGLAVSNLEKIKIAIPPLAVQQEIVEILDTFTTLEAELEAELEARKKQYEYYRDELLTFGDDVEWKTLGEIAVNLDSQRHPVTKSAREPGNIPYYGASGIVDYVSDYIFDGDYLLVSEDGANLLARSTPIAFSVSGKTWVNNHAHVLQFPSYAERRFVEIYLNSIDLSLYVSGAAQPKLNQANLNKIPIPIASLAEQERIVTILDKFDALVNDISVGLPAELNARRKQYEYYRDKLLTFPKKQ